MGEGREPEQETFVRYSQVIWFGITSRLIRFGVDFLGGNVKTLHLQHKNILLILLSKLQQHRLTFGNL